MIEPFVLSDGLVAELRRVVERWQQLPLDHAVGLQPVVRSLAQEVADETARYAHLPPMALPDLGPGVLMDQLVVVVQDAAYTKAVGEQELTDRLVALRSQLRRS